MRRVTQHAAGTPELPRSRRHQSAGSRPGGAAPWWPGADPAMGASFYLDQLGLWDRVFADQAREQPEGPRFDPAGCHVAPIPARRSRERIEAFLARHHYTAGAGMRGFNLGLFRGSDLLGVAVFSRVCRPRWARENFHLLPRDARLGARERRHLTVTEAEYAALSRFALAPADALGRPLGKGAASWFLSRCLAAMEARNRLLWSAWQSLVRGHALSPAQLRVLREAHGADDGRGRGFIKAIVSWADPFEGHLGRVYQILAMHYVGRTNGGRWRRERVGMRSGRRLSARTLAKARNPREKGHTAACLRLAWEGGAVRIDVLSAGGARTSHLADWVREAATGGPVPSEPEINLAISAAWTRWAALHVPPGGAVETRWIAGTGIRTQSFPSKHTYLVGLGAPWYRRQTEVRHRGLTQRLLAEERERRPTGTSRHDRRQEFYPRVIPPEEIRPELRSVGAVALNALEP